MELSWTIWESFRTSLKTPGAIRYSYKLIQTARENFLVREGGRESVRLPDLELLLCETESELKMANFRN